MPSNRKTNNLPSLSFADAAATVLEASGSPLHYREIAQRAIDQGLLKTDGKTPEATLNAVLAVDIKQRGRASRFTRIKPGIFGLQAWRTNSSEPLLQTFQDADEDRRVRIPLFPLYSEVRLILPLWHGCLRSQITGLHATLETLTGTPQSPVNWTNPEDWIPQRLHGTVRILPM